MTTVLIDFNNLCFRHFFANKEIGITTPNPDFSLWRYMVIYGIYNLMNKFNNIDEVVIAVDDRSSWRKSYFSRYKESRKKTRDKSEVDFLLLYSQIEEYQKELKHHFPFKVLKVRSAEADDVIAVLAMEGKRDYVVVSNDEDYLQLVSKNVRIWNPGKNEFSVCEDPEKFVIKKCLMGQAKDDIFNILTPDDWGMTEETQGKRKPGFGKVAYEKVENLEEFLRKPYINKTYKKPMDLERHFKRNKVLMDFKKIPNTIRERIWDVYEKNGFPPPNNIHEFFKKFHMRSFLENWTAIEPKFMRLY